MFGKKKKREGGEGEETHLERGNNIYTNSDRQQVPPLMSFTAYVCLDCTNNKGKYVIEFIKIQGHKINRTE